MVTLFLLKYNLELMKLNHNNPTDTIELMFIFIKI